MPRGNPSPKLAITIDPDIHEKVLAAGRPRQGERLCLDYRCGARSTTAAGWFGGGRAVGKAARTLHARRDERSSAQRAESAPETANGPPFGMGRVVYDAAPLVAADRTS